MDRHITLLNEKAPVQLTSPPCSGHHGGEHILHVIAVINNFVRFQRRYELYWKFKQHMESCKNVVLYTCEVAFGDRPFMVTSSDNPRHLQLRTEDELWIKENTINLMVQRLPLNWRYMAWIDADVEFLNKDFAIETIHALQHHRIVQMFETAINMGPDGEAIGTVTSFMSRYIKNPDISYNTSYAGTWHPGFAWACTREAMDGMGGLIDFAILGAGDHHMALAWIGEIDKSCHGRMHPNYKKKLKRFEKRCERVIKRDVGYVKGTIVHGWHGRFKNRRYGERWAILVDNNFDPDEDIKYNSQGLLVFDDEKVGLRDGIRAYFRQRNEDGVEND